MADNVTLNSGSGGATMRTDDDGTAQWPYVKLAYGADNTQTVVTSTATNPLPVALSDTDNAVLDTIDTVLDTINAKLVTGTTIGAVEIAASQTIAVTNAGTFACQVDGAALTALQLIDDAVYTDGTGTPSKGIAVMGTDGTNPQLISVDSSGNVQVDLVTANVTNAGTFACQVDGAALTALQLIDDAVYVDDADWTATSSKHGLIGGVYQSSPGSITDGDTGPLRLTVNGAAHVDVQNTVTVDLGANNDVIQATHDNFNANANVQQGNADVGSGNPLEVTLANGSVPSHAVTNAGTFAVQVDAALPAGSNSIGKLAANSGVDIGDVDVLSIAAGSNLIGDVGIQGRTTGGLSIYYDNDLDETAVAVKAGAGTLYAIHVINTTNAILYLQLFNVAQGSVTVGTTTPTVQFVVPGNNDTDGAGFTFSVPQGIAFGTAITAACSTNSEGNGAPGANACHCNLFYK